MRPVFISYARSTSRESARALGQALGGLAFLDETEIGAAERFPERLIDALLGSRVVVVFPDETYFTQRYCRWELQAALEPFAPGPARQLSHLVVVLPAGGKPPELDRFPSIIQTTHWRSADDTTGVADLVRVQLERSRATLGQRYAELGQPEAIVRARLLELSANPAPESLAGIPKFPTPFLETKRDRFVGRADDLWRIDFAIGTLRGDVVAAALTGSIEGAGGVGKTQLALEYAHRFGRRRFPGGIFWIDAEEKLEPQYHGILQALDPSIPDLPAYRESGRDAYGELAAALDRAPPDPRILLIIDNIPETPPRPLSTWCPALGKVTVLTTSRAKLSTTEPVYPVPVGALASDAAVQLLTSGVAPPTPIADCRLISEWVGRLPLALTLLNATLRLKGTTIEKLAAKARSPAGQTVELDKQMKALRGRIPEGALRGVTEAFAESYALLTREAQQAARLVARLAPTPIPTPLADALGLSPEICVLLTAYSFVTEGDAAMVAGEPPWFMLGSMHRVLADYLRTRAEDPNGEWDRVRAALAALLSSLHDSPSRWRVMQACVAHAQHVLRTRPSLPHERDAALGELALAVSDCVGTLARPDDAAGEVQEALHAYRMRLEARLEAFRPALADTLDSLSLQELGQWEESMRRMRENLELRKGIMRPPEDLIGAENHRQVFHHGTEEEVERYRKNPYDRRFLAEALRAHSSALGKLGRREDALRATQEAVEICRRLMVEDPHHYLRDLGASLSDLAADLRALGRGEEELRALNEVVEAYRKAEVWHLPELLYNLSVRSGVLGRREEALRAAEEAVQLYRSLAEVNPWHQHQNNLAAALNNLSVQWGELEQWEKALQAAEEALAIRRTIAGWPEIFLPGMVRSLNVRAWLLDHVGRTDEARASADEATAIRARIDALRT